MGFDERHDEKGAVLVEIGLDGLARAPSWLPLEATPFFDVAILDPSADLPRLGADYPEAVRALVRVRATYTPGVDDPDAIHRRIRAEVFPAVLQPPTSSRCGPEATTMGPGCVAARFARDSRETVLDYLRARLDGQEHAEAVLAEAEELIGEVRP